MADDLFDETVAYLGHDRSVASLSGVLDISSEENLRVGIALATSAFVANLARWADDPVGASWLAARLPLTRSNGDLVPIADVDLADCEAQGSTVVELVVGPGRNELVRTMAVQAGIEESSADGLLSISAWSVMAHLAARYGEPLDREALVAALDGERKQLIDGGWGPWLDATSGAEVDVSAAAVADSTGMSHGGGHPPPVGRERRTQLPARPPEHRSPPVETDVERHRASRDPHDRQAAAWAAPDSPAAAHTESGAVATAPAKVHTRPRLDEPDEPDGVTFASRQRLPLALALLLAAVALASLVFLVMSIRGDGDTTDTADAPGTDQSTVVDNATDGSTTDSGASGDAVTDADGADGSGGESTGSPDGGSNSTDVVSIESVMTDPLGNTEATATSTMNFNTVTGEICYAMDVNGLNAPFDGHIHIGPAGVKGGIVVDFGPLTGSPVGCIDNPPLDTQRILDDLAGHYVELHDADEVSTIRRQLSESDAPVDSATAEEDADAYANGAYVVIGDGVLSLEGEVPDQETVDTMIAGFADIELGDTEFQNNLQIVEGATRPSGRIVVAENILFGVDSAELADADNTVLDDLAKVFLARPAWTMAVVGHTDGSGPAPYNLELSLARANAVRDFMVASGVPAEAMSVEGAGDTSPIASNDTPEGRAQNRRIEFRVVAG